MFKNPKTVGIIRDALYDAAERHGMAIKEMSFGEDFAHVHMEVSIPNTMSISYAVQLLKGYSSYRVFKEMPGTNCDISKDIFGPQDTAMEVLAQEMKIHCRTTSGSRTFQDSCILPFNPSDTATFRSQRGSLLL